MLVMTCTSSAAPSTSSVASRSIAPVRAKPSVAPTSTGLKATSRLLGRIATIQAATDPERTDGGALAIPRFTVMPWLLRDGGWVLAGAWRRILGVWT